MTAALEEFGLTRSKAQAIRELTKRVREGDLNLSRTANLNQVQEQLLQIKGIGPWTVEMIAMRCLCDADAFPDRDLIIQWVLKLKIVDVQERVSIRSYRTHLLWRDYASSLSKSKRLSFKES